MLGTTLSTALLGRRVSRIWSMTMSIFNKTPKTGSDQITITITFGPEYTRGMYRLLGDLPKVVPQLIKDIQAMIVAIGEVDSPKTKE